MLANHGSSKSPKRVLLDMSQTYNSPHQTGIQRVVRSLHRELPRAARRRGMDYLAVVWQDGNFVALDSIQEPAATTWRDIDQIREDVVAHCPRAYVNAAEVICWCLPFKALRKLLLPEPGRKGVFSLPLELLRLVARATGGKSSKPDASAPQAIETNQQDLLILPEGYWIMMEVFPAIEAAKQRGTRIAHVIHDALCITHPQFFVPQAKEIFTAFLREMCRYADVVCTASSTWKQHLDEILPPLVEPGKTLPNICYARNGAEFSRIGGQIRGELRSLFESRPGKTYLMVSTFEPRKNHSYVLDAFDQFWQSHPDSTLVFVGAVGWMCEPFLERIQLHQQLGRSLFVFHDLSDAEVAHCYGNCSAVIFPSYYEGFGLPIIESLWYGKKTFAGDTAISREVGGDDCEYFALEDPAQLSNLLIEYEHKADRVVGPQRKIESWAQAIDGILAVILKGLSEQDRLQDVRKAA